LTPEKVDLYISIIEIEDDLNKKKNLVSTSTMVWLF